MRLLPTLLAVVPFLSLAAFAEPGGPVGLVSPARPMSPSAPTTVTVTGKVFFDDGVEEGIEFFRLQILKDGEVVTLVNGDEFGLTDENGCYTLEFQRQGRPRGYELKILGPTGDPLNFGFIGDGVVGASWLLTGNQSSTVPIDIRASDPGEDFGVLSYGAIVDGVASPNLVDIRGESFWCDKETREEVLAKLAPHDVDVSWRLLLNSFCLQYSCLTNQFEAKNGFLVLQLNNDLSSAVEQVCNFFQKEPCGLTLMHRFSEAVALVQLSVLSILEVPDDEVFISVGGVLFNLATRGDGARELLCDPRALDPEADPDYLAMVMACINEWDDAADSGVFGRTETANEVVYGDEN